MKIAVVGLGGIGSTFAFQLAQVGHDVTVVARGKRLEQLQRDAAIVNSAGKRSAVRVSAALDAATPWDLVLVTVLAHQVDAVLPALRDCAAKTIMFMFNTFETLDRLRDAVGPARFAFGFPAILASVDGGQLTSQIVTRGMVTTVTDAAFAKVFTDAGITAVVHSDMESWLRTHVAAVVPVMILAGESYSRQAGSSWKDAMRLARAMEEGFRVVRQLGNAITPAPMGFVSRLPTPVRATLMWTLSRVPVIRKSGAAGFGEPRALIDAMNAVVPGQIPTILSVRP